MKTVKLTFVNNEEREIAKSEIKEAKVLTMAADWVARGNGTVKISKVEKNNGLEKILGMAENKA